MVIAGSSPNDNFGKWYNKGKVKMKNRKTFSG
jgi:hypothetical protein